MKMFHQPIFQQNASAKWLLDEMADEVTHNDTSLTPILQRETRSPSTLLVCGCWHQHTPVLD